MEYNNDRGLRHQTIEHNEQEHYHTIQNNTIAQLSTTWTFLNAQELRPWVRKPSNQSSTNFVPS